MNKQSKISLHIMKTVIITFLLTIGGYMLKIMANVFSILAEERKNIVGQYLWLEPLDLQAIIDHNSWTISENGSTILYLYLANYLALLLIIIFILYTIFCVCKDVWRTNDNVELFKATQNFVCWILTYITMNIINHFWSIEYFLENNLFHNGVSVFVFYEKILFVWVIMHTVKIIYYGVTKKVLSLPSYMKKTVWGE